MANFPYMQFQAYNPIDSAIKTAMGVYEGIGQGKKRNLELEKLRAEQPYWEEQARIARDLERLNLQTAPALAQAEISRAQTAAAQARTAEQQTRIAQQAAQREAELHPYALEERRREAERQQYFHDLGIYDPKAQEVFSKYNLYGVLSGQQPGMSGIGATSAGQQFIPQQFQSFPQQPQQMPSLFEPSAGGLSDQYGPFTLPGVQLGASTSIPAQVEPTSMFDKVALSSPPQALQSIASSVRPANPQEAIAWDAMQSLGMSAMSEPQIKALETKNKENEKYKAEMLYKTVPSSIKRSDTILADIGKMKEIWSKIPEKQKGWAWGHAPKYDQDAQTFQALASRILFEEVDKLRGLGPASEADMARLERTVPEITLNDESFEYLINSYENIVKRVKEHGEFMSSALTPQQFGGKGLDLDAANYLWNNYVLNNPMSEISSQRSIDELLKEAEGYSEEELEALARGK